MRRMKQLVLVIAMLSLPFLMSACAGVQSDYRIRAKVVDGGFAKSGDSVHLFYGMSKQAKEEFCINSVVPVYRMGKGYYLIKSEVGKIKVTKDLGDHYIEAVVIEGEIRTGDIAMQPNSECLITLPKPEAE